MNLKTKSVNPVVEAFSLDKRLYEILVPIQEAQEHLDWIVAWLKRIRELIQQGEKPLTLASLSFGDLMRDHNTLRSAASTMAWRMYELNPPPEPPPGQEYPF